MPSFPKRCSRQTCLRSLAVDRPLELEDALVEPARRRGGEDAAGGLASSFMRASSASAEAKRPS